MLVALTVRRTVLWATMIDGPAHAGVLCTAGGSRGKAGAERPPRTERRGRV